MQQRPVSDWSYLRVDFFIRRSVSPTVSSENWDVLEQKHRACIVLSPRNQSQKAIRMKRGDLKVSENDVYNHTTIYPANTTKVKDRWRRGLVVNTLLWDQKLLSLRSGFTRSTLSSLERLFICLSSPHLGVKRVPGYR